MCALGSPSGTGRVLLSGPTNAPADTSSHSVSRTSASNTCRRACRDLSGCCAGDQGASRKQPAGRDTRRSPGGRHTTPERGSCRIHALLSGRRNGESQSAAGDLRSSCPDDEEGVWQRAIRAASPPRMCSSERVSPKRSGGAATVPRSSSPSFARNDSRNDRPFSFSLRARRDQQRGEASQRAP